MFIFLVLITTVSSDLLLVGFKTPLTVYDDRDIYMFDTSRDTFLPWRKSQSTSAKIVTVNDTETFFVNSIEDRIEITDMPTNTTNIFKADLNCNMCTAGARSSGTCICDGAVSLKKSNQLYVISRNGSTYYVHTVLGNKIASFTSNPFQDCHVFYSTEINVTWVILMFTVGVGQKSNIFVKEIWPNITKDLIMPEITQQTINAEFGFFETSFYWIVPNGNFWNIHSYDIFNGSAIVVRNLTLYNPTTNILHTPNNTKCTFLKIYDASTFYVVVSFVQNFRNSVQIVKITVPNTDIFTLWNSSIDLQNATIDFFSKPWETNYLFSSSNTITTLSRYKMVSTQNNSNSTSFSSKGSIILNCLALFLFLVYLQK